MYLLLSELRMNVCFSNTNLRKRTDITQALWLYTARATCLPKLGSKSL